MAACVILRSTFSRGPTVRETSWSMVIKMVSFQKYLNTTPKNEAFSSPLVLTSSSHNLTERISVHRVSFNLTVTGAHARCTLSQQRSVGSARATHFSSLSPEFATWSFSAIGHMSSSVNGRLYLHVFVFFFKLLGIPSLLPYSDKHDHRPSRGTFTLTFWAVCRPRWSHVE